MKISRYFAKKAISTIQSEANNKELRRSLSGLNLISLGIGCIIGAGIFVMTGKAAADHAGPAIMLSFIIAGIACVFAALCYAELASVLPVSGSAYTYAYATLGEFFAWIMGWLLLLEYGLSASTVAVGWSGYVVSFLKDLNIVIPQYLTSPYFNIDHSTGTFTILHSFNIFAFLIVILLSLLLARGVKESANFNNFIVALKLTVVLSFIIIGFYFVKPENWHPFIPDYIPPVTPSGEGKYGFPGILRAASIIFFAYVGFEAVSTAAQEAKNPSKDMPVGILGSLIICTIIYILVCAVMTGVVSYKELSVPDPMAVAVDKIGLKWFSYLIKFGAITGLTSVMLVLLYGQMRIFYVMSHDGLIPKIFSKVHHKYQTPYLNSLIVGFVVAITSSLTPINILGDLVSLGTLLAFSIVCFTVIYLRIKRPDLERPFKCPLVPLVPILGILLCTYLISSMPITTFHFIKWWLIFGIIVYFAYGQFKSKINNNI